MKQAEYAAGTFIMLAGYICLLDRAPRNTGMYRYERAFPADVGWKSSLVSVPGSASATAKAA
jgi:hypothetical protein